MKKVILVLIPVLVVGIILATGCGISEDVLAGVQAELDTAQQELETSKSDLAGVTAERDSSVAEFDALQAKLDTLIVAGDTVRAHIPSDFGPLCVLSTQFARGEGITWRLRVWDPETGMHLPADSSELIETQPDADALAAMVEGLTVTVHLSDGQTFPARFAGHGGEGDIKGDYFWTAFWAIPVDYPTGTLEDWVTVEWKEGGKTGTSQPIDISYSKLTILEETISGTVVFEEWVAEHPSLQDY